MAALGSTAQSLPRMKATTILMTDEEFDAIHFLVELPAGSSWTIGDGPNGTYMLMATCPAEPIMSPLNKKLKLEIPFQVQFGD